MVNTILLADLVDWFSLTFLWNVFLVCLVLGFLIFIHEFGHFIVAKACGVKCEKFYIGFDFFGWKLWKYQWGETEYGIGVFPLGGYVKMLGQEDNPGELREEYERSKLAIYKNDADTPSEEVFSQQQEAIHDPRSYLAKPVWQRMAIIVAGVTMNAIFAFVAGIIAVSYGIPENPPEITVVPGAPAWNAGLKSGDTIVSVNGTPTPTFSKLQTNIVLAGKSSEGLHIGYRTADNPDKLESTSIQTASNGMNQVIGIQRSMSLELVESMPGEPNSPAGLAFYSPKEKKMSVPQGSAIKAINGTPVQNYAQFEEILRINRDIPVTIEVGPSDKSKEKFAPKQYTIQPRPMRGFGLIMKMGKVTGVRPNSPAALAGVQPGDVLTLLDDLPISDPITFPQLIEKKIYQTQDGKKIAKSAVIKLGIERSIKLKPEEIERDNLKKMSFDIEINPTEDFAPNIGSSIGVPELGVAYEVSNVVSYVVPNSPAEEAGIKAGTVFDQFQFIAAPFPENAPEVGVLPSKWRKIYQNTDWVTMTTERPNWVSMIFQYQFMPAGTKLKLHSDNGSYELSAVELPEYYAQNRGINTPYIYSMAKAHSFGQAVSMGVAKTNEMFTMVVRMIQRLCTQDVSVKGLGGPVILAQMAYSSADQGLGMLMLFTCMISANLAVFNLLPIPVVDGGHVVFLTWEWITGTPPPESVMVILSYIGLFLLLALMVWTLALDLKFIPRF